jgi:hypothetical protein
MRAKKSKNESFDRIWMAVALALGLGFTGCAGYVGADYGGGGVVVADPDVYVFGGTYDRGHDVHVYSHRGAESRAVAHPHNVHAPAHVGVPERKH